VTAQLFQKYHTAEDYANVSQEEFEENIKKITFFRNKAKNIRAACQYLIDHHNGEVPRTMTELVKIPGVARKTANVVMGNAFNISEGFIVDTHVNRIVQRFGWTAHEDPVKQEQDLMRLIPQEHWLGLAFRIIYHGRAICDARKPHCDSCTLATLCPSTFKIKSK
jgi:endonuclease-3